LRSALNLSISVPDHSLPAKYREWSGTSNLNIGTGVVTGGVVAGIGTGIGTDIICKRIWSIEPQTAPLTHPSDVGRWRDESILKITKAFSDLPHIQQTYVGGQKK